jgi:AcrR family transcriptional regulator
MEWLRLVLGCFSADVGNNGRSSAILSIERPIVKRMFVFYSSVMPRVSQEHLDARRRQIVEAALRCFARNGIHPTSMQDIFAEASLSAGAVYRYFPTKESLVAAVVEKVLGMSQSAVDPTHEGNDAAQGIEGVLDRLLSVFGDPGPADEQARYGLVLQIWAEAIRSPQVGDALRASTARLRAIVVDRIVSAQAAGELRPDVDPFALSRAVTALFEGYAFQRALDPEIDTEAYGRAVRALLQHGATTS